METNENMHAIRYHNRHEALSAMLALAKESFLTDPEIVISASNSRKTPKMLVLSRDEGTLPDKKGWERYVIDEKIEAFVLVASTDSEDKRRFTVTYLPDMGDVLMLNFISGMGEDEENVVDFLLSM